MAKAKKEPASKSPLDLAIALIEKQFGSGSIQVGSGTFVRVEAIPTGIVNVDLATGCGGIPRARITEVYGNESSGKSTFCLALAASAQQHNKIVAYVDAEHSLDLDWAKAQGIDRSKLIMAQPDSGNEALTIVETLVDGRIDLVIIDSVAALIPKEEFEGEIGDRAIGAQARLMSQALRKLVSKCQRSNAAVVFVNQLRDKIGGFSPGFGTPENTPGGRALKFYSSLRIELRRKDTLLESGRAYGVRAKVKVVKNKVAPPFATAEFEIHFGQPFQVPVSRKGIFKQAALCEAAIECGVLKLAGSHFYFGEAKKRVANGREAMVELLCSDDELAKQVSDAVYTHIATVRKDAGGDAGGDADVVVSSDVEEGDKDNGDFDDSEPNLTEQES